MPPTVIITFMQAAIAATKRKVGEARRTGYARERASPMLKGSQKRLLLRLAPVKTAEQQAVLVLHRTRDLLVRQRTALVTALRGNLAEFGIVAPQGMSRVADLLAVLLGEDEATLLPLARQALRGLAAGMGRDHRDLRADISAVAGRFRRRPTVLRRADRAESADQLPLAARRDGRLPPERRGAGEMARA